MMSTSTGSIQGAPDISRVPTSSKTDSPNHPGFLKTLRSLLPSGKSTSIAIPASYWYLKGLPIAEIADVLNYVVFMTYDWDSSFDSPQCENSNFFCSRISLAETEYALGIIKKAGVPANKAMAGIASYNHSPSIEDPRCTGPDCLTLRQPWARQPPWILTKLKKSLLTPSH